MGHNKNLVARIFRQPDVIKNFDENDWDLLIRQSRSADLLATIKFFFDRNGLLDFVPDYALRHIDSANVYADALERDVRWEVIRLSEKLSTISVPVILLKGAAYIFAQLTSAKGRIFNDIDILVPKDELDRVEQVLMTVGWRTTYLDDYDQKYYRKWMHELPPMRHVSSKAVLDIHHAILPDTARLHPDPEKLIRAAKPIAGNQNLLVLSPADMVLHSATHLFHDGELEHGLRDLADQDNLLRHFGEKEGFWGELTDRARELGLLRPLYYALYYTVSILATPVPDDVIEKVNEGKPVYFLSAIMDFLFSHALVPDHPSCDAWVTSIARWCLYVRSHYLRMPLYLLIPHLVRKAFRRKGSH